MPLPDLLNLAIGLIVLYFLLSTICSVVVDLFARFTRYREELLTVTINSIVSGEKDKPWNVFSLIIDRIKNEILTLLPGNNQGDPELLLPLDSLSEEEKAKLTEAQKDQLKAVNEFAATFWSHPEIKPLASNYLDAPASIPAETFARAIVDISIPRDLQGALPQSKVGFLRRLTSNKAKIPESIFQLLNKTASSSDIAENTTGENFWKAFYGRVEKRYDDSMGTASQRFEGWTQKWLFIIGLTVATLLNADSIQFIRTLSTSGETRADIAQYAEKNLKELEKLAEGKESEKTAESSSKEDIQLTLTHLKNLSGIGFPIGWSENGGNLYPYTNEKIECPTFLNTTLIPYGLKLIGLLTTAFAINLGAPFWYGLLSKLIGARQKAGLSTANNGEEEKSDPRVAKILDSQSPCPLEIGRDLASANSGFDSRKAYWLAEASDLAYLEEVQISDKVCNEWFLPKPTFVSATDQGVDTQLFAVATEEVALIAFRGTEPNKIHDICNDADIRMAPMCAPDSTEQIEAHSGFISALSPVYTAICDFLNSEDVSKVNHVYLTGHSLGGALSIALAARLALENHPASKKIIIYNFGCPRVGDSGFAKYFNKTYAGRVTRVVNEDDIVTKIAPMMPFGFRHVGTMLHFKEDGTFAFDVPTVERLLDFGLSVTEGTVEAGKKSVGDHSMGTYKERCLRLTGATQC